MFTYTHLQKYIAELQMELDLKHVQVSQKLCCVHDCCIACRFEQTGGRVQLEFERPTDNNGPESRAIPVNSPLRLLVARGGSDDITSWNGYHG